MTVYCGWASQDEHGGARGGAAGDQTALEVRVGPWYYFGQEYVLRWKSRKLAKKAADVCKRICNNKHVGYDQDQRTTLYYEMKRVGWDPDKISKNVETDCSAMIAVICNAVGVKISKDVYTGNLREALIGTGQFSELTGATYCESPEYARYGDIILNTARHVIMALDDGPGTKVIDQAKNPPKHAYTGTLPVLPAKGYLREGDEGTQVKRLQQFLNWYGGYNLAVDGSYGPKTKAAVKKYQKAEGLVSDGFFGPASLKKAKAVRK